MTNQELRLSGIRAIKNADSEILDCNEAFLSYSGEKTQAKIVGKTDYDLPWGEYADFYRAHELDALSNRFYSAVIPLNDFQNNQRLFLHSKISNVNEQQETVILCHAVEILNPDFHHLFNHLKDGALPETIDKTHYIGRETKNIKLSIMVTHRIFLASITLLN